MVRVFRVFLWPPVCTPAGIVKVCFGSRVFTHPRPQRWPHRTTAREGQHLRVAISKVDRLGGRPYCLYCLSPFWPQSGGAWVGGERLGWEKGVREGGSLAGTSNVLRSTDFWQHHSIWWRKMPPANESQQCLSNWTATRKALCNWDTVNISNLSLNKLSVFIFSTLDLIFLKQFEIEGTTLLKPRTFCLQLFFFFLSPISVWASNILEGWTPGLFGWVLFFVKP